jgi:hypothetical protein
MEVMSMHIYIVPKGTSIVLANDNGPIELIRSKKEVTFGDNELVEDLVILYNRRRDTPGFTPKAPEHVSMLYNDDYAMFNIGQTHTNKPFKYAFIAYKNVEVL